MGEEVKENSKFKWFVDSLGDAKDTMSDGQIGAAFLAAYLRTTNDPFVAMTFAQGETAKKGATKPNLNGYSKESTRLRSLFQDAEHLQALGQMHAIDLFMGNGDRLAAGNLGNWVYDPYGAITTLDHVDPYSMNDVYSKKFKEQIKDPEEAKNGKVTFSGTLSELSRKHRTKALEHAIGSMIQGMAGMGGDEGAVEWANEGRGWRKNTMETYLSTGMDKGVDLIIKTFSSTRWNTKKGSDARSTKKAIKQASREAHTIAKQNGRDEAANDPDAYWKIIKARAEWVKKNAK
jgi:hypothetical protein